MVVTLSCNPTELKCTKNRRKPPRRGSLTPSSASQKTSTKSPRQADTTRSSNGAASKSAAASRPPTKRSQSVAWQELKQKASKLRTGKEYASITFEKYSERWIKAKEASLKSLTIRRMKDCLKGIKPYLGNNLIRNITYQDCERWLIGRGKELKASAYRQERQLMIGVLKAAERDGIILDNPATNCQTRKCPKIEIHVPTHDQFRSLIKQMRQADSRGIHGAYLVELLAYSGMRLNEAINLTWQDTDFDRGCFTVTGGEYGTKNHDIRTVPLFPAMRELLERIRSDQTETNSDYVTPIKGARTLMAKRRQKGLHTKIYPPQHASLLSVPTPSRPASTSR